MFSTREWISSPHVLNMDRSCSASNASSNSLVEGRVGGVLSSSSWSSSISSFSPSITSAMISSSLEKEADVTTSLSRATNYSADRYGWMESLSNSCTFSRSSSKLLNGSLSSFTAACWFDWLVLDFLKH